MFVDCYENLFLRDTTPTTTEYQSDLDASHHSDSLTEHDEVEDDYTPPDPTYLPPGLEDEGGPSAEIEVKKGSNF